MIWPQHLYGTCPLFTYHGYEIFFELPFVEEKRFFHRSKCSDMFNLQHKSLIFILRSFIKINPRVHDICIACVIHDGLK